MNPQRHILEKILNSESFKERELYRNLLTYIVEKSFKGITPKEVTIAHDVFHKGDNFYPAGDTTVRVHMHKLRKYLELYYQTEGQTDEIKLYIPKGHYQVKFIKNTAPENRSNKSRGKLTIITLSTCLFCALLYIFAALLYTQKQNRASGKIDRGDAIWGHFFANDFTTAVVIGDFFVFHEYNDKLNRSIRIQDYEINTVEDLNRYIDHYPEKGAESWFLGEIPHNSIFNLVDIYPVFLSFKEKLHIDFTTDIEIDYIKNKNMIYIGEFKNFRALSDLVSHLPVVYETLPWWHGRISYRSGDSTKTLRTSHDWNVNRYVVDLGLIAKLPGQNDENYLIIAGFGYNSQIKLVEMLSRNASLKELADRIRESNGTVPDYFTAVFEVSGFDRASTTAELKFFQEIDRDYFKNYTKKPPP